jgi:hypothetical protein
MRERALQWIAGRDTGISSKTIWSVMMGVEVLGTEAWSLQYDVPLDPDDFGRCYRLLELIPGWRARLGEVADRFPAWRPLVEHWSELEALYRPVVETPGQRWNLTASTVMYDRMVELRGLMPAPPEPR